MHAVTFTNARRNLSGVMDRVMNDRAPVVVTRRRAEAVVVVSLDDWAAMEEAMHLLPSFANETI